MFLGLLICFPAVSARCAPADSPATVLDCLHLVVGGEKETAEKHLKRMLSESTEESARARVALAELRFREKHYGEAQKILTGGGTHPAELLPGIAGNIYLLEARVCRASKKHEEALKKCGEAAKAGLAPEFLENVRLLAVRCLRDLEREGELIPACDGFLKQFPTSAYGREVRWTRAKALYDSGKTKTAFDEAMGLWKESPDSYYGRKAASLLITCERKKGLKLRPGTLEERVDMVRRLIHSRKGKRALAEIRSLRRFRLSESQKDELDFREAEALYAAGKKYDSAVKCRRIMKRRPSSDFVDRAAKLRLRSAKVRGYPDLAKEIGEWIVRKGKEEEIKDEVRYSLGFSAKNRRKHNESITYLLPIIKRGDASEYFERACWNCAWNYMALNRGKDAYGIFSTLLRGKPGTAYRPPALYWMGKIRFEQGRRREARLLWKELIAEAPVSYYGYLAARRIGRVPAPATPGANPGMAERVERVFQNPSNRLKGLVGAGLLTDAAALLDREIPDERENQLLAAWLLAASGQYRRSIHLLSSSFPKEVWGGGKPVPTEFWTLLYPTPHGEIVERYAKNRKLAPPLLYALIRQESAFDTNAVSRAGAIGLMQVMKGTANEIARRMRIRRPRRSRLKNPRVNVMLGSYHLADLLRKYEGELPLVLAAYNAGYGNLKKWLKHYPRDDIERFVEMIPFTETRLYVKNVLRAKWEYERVYKSRR